MSRSLSYAIIIIICGLLAVACSGKSGPTIPDGETDLTKSVESGHSATHLWGLYNIWFDSESGEMRYECNRQAMFTANVVNFLNNNPANLGFQINSIDPLPDALCIDIDISITHPFPGLPQYHGYDVRGAFMANGSGSLDYNSELTYAIDGMDQFMKTNPDTGSGGPDGYTRWFNFPEFSEGGMPLLQYTDGIVATPGYEPPATLNPYKYFANGLESDEGLFDWLVENFDQDGIFTSGATNSRNYYLCFPDVTGVTYSYAVIANWGGPDQQDHPSNAPEAVGCMVSDNSDVWYVDSTSNGGDIVLDISIFDRDAALTSVVMEDYSILVESMVLSLPASIDMSPSGGTDVYSTYHAEIPADNVTGVTGQEYWVIVEENGADYTNDLGVPNLADTDTLAAFFRYDLAVAGEPDNNPPVINGITDDIDPDGLNEEVTDYDTEVTYIVDFTDPDVGQTHAIDWYIEDSGAGAPSDPPDAIPYDWSLKDLGEYEIYVTVDDGFEAVTGGPYDVTKVECGWIRTWGASFQDRGYGTEVDSNGDIYTCGNFYYNVDFDPGDGIDEHNSGGNRDSFITKFDAEGNHLWAHTWGGNVSFGGGATDLAVDTLDDVVMSGYFYGTDVDFDPGAGEDLHSCDGEGADCYITKFNSDGTHQWAATWGGDDYLGDSVLGIDTDESNNVYAVGGFRGTCDFDPGPGTDTHASNNGYRDHCLVKYDSAGNYQWGVHWGGPYDDYSFGCTTDSYGGVYVAGRYYKDCDFDPGPGEVWYNSEDDGNMFIEKFNSDGEFLWVKVFGQGDSFRVALDSNNYVYVSGVFSGTSQFDPDNGTAEVTANGVRDCFLSKFDSDGIFQWVLTWDGIMPPDTTSGYIGHHVTIDDDDYIYCTGHFTGTVDLDPDPVDIDEHVSHGLRDCFVTKFDPDGDHVWSRTFGAESTDDGGGISVDPLSGAVYVTGWFYGTVDFRPGDGIEERIAAGSIDAFLLRLLSDGNW